MPTLAFTDRRLAGLKPGPTQRDYFDAALAGFGVRVSPRGRKTFMLLHRINGRLQRLTLREAETGISTYPKLTLARARDLAREALRGSTLGKDVRSEHQQQAERTFGALRDVYLEQHAKRKKRSWREDARMIRKDLAAWRDRPVTSIRRADVRDMLEAIVARKAPVLANRVLSLVVKMFNLAVDREWLDANPAARMARPAAEQSRSRVLTGDELRTVWAWLERPAPKDDRDIDPEHWKLAQMVLKLRLVTAQRGREVIHMRWSDLDGDWWTIPPEIAKNKLAHRVPLSKLALDLLATVPKPAPKRSAAAGKKKLAPEGPAAVQTDYLFAGIRGARHRRGVLTGLPIADVRPHDFRRTAASHMAAAGIPRLTISKLLNHVESGITAVYDRHSYDPEKRVALNAWARELAGIVSDSPRAGADVVPISKRRSAKRA